MELKKGKEERRKGKFFNQQWFVLCFFEPFYQRVASANRCVEIEDRRAALYPLLSSSPSSCHTKAAVSAIIRKAR
jgi:hypothetical protein